MMKKILQEKQKTLELLVKEENKSLKNFVLKEIEEAEEKGYEPYSDYGPEYYIEELFDQNIYELYKKEQRKIYKKIVILRKEIELLKTGIRNEQIARNATKSKNQSFKKEGHELHMINIVIHKLCVDAVGVENWNSNNKCPVQLFDKELEELINKAVDLGNWASIELYDPTGGLDY